MAKPRKIRTLLGLLKDKFSLIKTTLLPTSTRTASLHVAVLRATSHNPSHSPPAHIVDDVLTLTLGPGHQHGHAAGVLVHALLERVHRTSDVYVALKCLVTLHHLMSRGSHVINDQIIWFCNERGPLFELERFNDQSDDDTCELSNWVRWYANVLDNRILMTSSNSFSFLIYFLEKISGCPNSLHYQKISLIYDVIKLIGEDYRVIIREIYAKIEEFSMKFKYFSDDLLDKFLSDLSRIEKYKEKLFLMFLNKKRNDGFWELIENVIENVRDEKKLRENMRIVKFYSTESTVQSTRQVEESKAIVVVSRAPSTSGKRWLDVEWNKMAVSTSA